MGRRSRVSQSLSAALVLGALVLLASIWPGRAGAASPRPAPACAPPVQVPALDVNFPANARLPYFGFRAYTGGPHSSAICAAVPLTSTSGLDFGGRFTVLSIAPGALLARATLWPDGWWGWPGNYVAIDHGFGLVSMYWHLERFSPEMEALTVGSRVPQGFPLGTSGTSGNQTDLHLHLELRYFSPQAYLAFDPGDYQTWGQRVAWDGLSMDGWTFYTHRIPWDPASGWSYQGTAVRGLLRESPAEIVLNECGPLPALALVGRAFERGEERNYETYAEYCDREGLPVETPGRPPPHVEPRRIDRNTAFAFNYSQLVGLGSTNGYAAVLYRQTDYCGHQHAVRGLASLDEAVALGWAPQSVEVRPGWQVTLYAGAHFGGASLRLLGSVVDLRALSYPDGTPVAGRVGSIQTGLPDAP